MCPCGHQKLSLVAVGPWEDFSRPSEALVSAHLSGDVYSALGVAFELFFLNPSHYVQFTPSPLWRVSLSGEDLLTPFQRFNSWL